MRLLLLKIIVDVIFFPFFVVSYIGHYDYASDRWSHIADVTFNRTIFQYVRVCQSSVSSSYSG